MARNLKPFGVSVSYHLDENGNADNDHIEVTFKRRVEDGDDEIIGTRRYAPSDWGPNCRRRALLYGGSKIYQDRTSDLSGDESRLEEMDAVHARLVADQWEKERESTGRTISPAVEALAAIKGASVAAVQKALGKLDPEARERVLNSEVVQNKAAEIKEAREAATDVSLDDLAA